MFKRARIYANLITVCAAVLIAAGIALFVAHMVTGADLWRAFALSGMVWAPGVILVWLVRKISKKE